MARKASKARKGAAKSGKSAKKGRKIVWWMIGLALVILVGQSLLMMKSKVSTSKDFYVQTVLSFKGDQQECGPFHAWDVIQAGEQAIALTDQGQSKVLVFDMNGKFRYAITAKDAGEPKFNELSGVSYDGKGSIFVMDAWNGLIRGFGAKGEPGGKFPVPNSYGPRGVAISGGDFFVADTGTHRVAKLSPTGALLGSFGRKGSGKLEFWDPLDVAVDSNGAIYVADANNDRVQRIDREGKFVREYDAGSVVSGVAVDGQGRVYVSLLDGGVVKVFDGNGKFLGKVVLVDPKGQTLGGVKGLAITSTGDLIAACGGEIRILRPVPPPAP